MQTCLNKKSDGKFDVHIYCGWVLKYMENFGTLVSTKNIHHFRSAYENDHIGKLKDVETARNLQMLAHLITHLQLLVINLYFIIANYYFLLF